MLETEFYKHVVNEKCEYYPCHETEGSFNCLFCYCPLYALGEKCGGEYTYNEFGFKDCGQCTIPHTEDGFDYITSRYIEIAMLARKKREKKITQAG